MGEKKFTFECKIKEINLKMMSVSVADVWYNTWCEILKVLMWVAIINK